MVLIITFDHGIFQTINKDTLIQMSSVAIIGQWLMLFYWLRLFPALAFYVAMIIETIKDISTFMIMFVICITMFGNAVYALNQIEVVFFGDEDHPRTDLTYH